MYLGFTVQAADISIHALREEGDWQALLDRADPDGFLSTPSARRATLPGHGKVARVADFYPRPPRGGRPALVSMSKCWMVISIHALREEGDLS